MLNINLKNVRRNSSEDFIHISVMHRLTNIIEKRENYYPLYIIWLRIAQNHLAFFSTEISSSITYVRLAEWSKASDLSSDTLRSAWVRTPHLTGFWELEQTADKVSEQKAGTFLAAWFSFHGRGMLSAP